MEYEVVWIVMDGMFVNYVFEEHCEGNSKGCQVELLMHHHHHFVHFAGAFVPCHLDRFLFYFKSFIGVYWHCLVLRTDFYCRDMVIFSSRNFPRLQ